MTGTRLRVCVLSEELSLPSDEGMKKFVASIIRPLAQWTDLLVLSTQPNGPLPELVEPQPTNPLLLSPALLRTLRTFRPDAVIYVPTAAATRNSFVRCAILRRYAPRARLVMVSLQPRSYGRVVRQ